MPAAAAIIQQGFGAALFDQSSDIPNPWRKRIAHELPLFMHLTVKGNVSHRLYSHTHSSCGPLAK